ncbi:hypothetical protein [Phenylobacterium sp.]|uniref:hypothetical protein n=1 Tax=Phenylobacterium sp. TaxID=1871053 RepID=UPI0026033A33|nr:hypothetical protein [Phenylobacterium sp.]
MDDGRGQLGAPTWLDAFNFAHEESMRAFEAMSHGDVPAAQSLLASAREANALAKTLFASTP